LENQAVFQIRGLRPIKMQAGILSSSIRGLRPIKMQSDKIASKLAFCHLPFAGFALSKCNLTKSPASWHFVIFHFGTAHCLPVHYIFFCIIYASNLRCFIRKQADFIR
jgi:hypothetical protein